MAIRTWLSLTRGLGMGRDFWRSYTAGLRGSDVRAMVLDAGFERADYEVAGCNYLITAIKRGAMEPA